MTGHFEKLFLSRRSAHNFIHTDNFDLNKLKKLLYTFSKNMPSKQDKYPYQIHIVDWSDFNLRKKFYEATLPFPGVHKNINNQIFAPILIAFTHSLDKSSESYTAPVEVGMAAMALTYLLQDNGYFTSFCGCISDPNNLANLLTKEENNTTRLILCVGETAISDTNISVYNPFTNDYIKQKHRRIWDKSPTIKYHVENLSDI